MPESLFRKRLTPQLSAPWLPALLLLLPILPFYILLARNAVNIPFMDDYDAAIGFVETWQREPSLGDKLVWFATSQHTQYKLYLQHAVYLAEIRFTGHLNFVFLQALGNLSILIIFLALWKIIRRTSVSLTDSLWLSLPVAFLLFAPTYWETVDWAMGGLQNLTGIAFSMLSFVLLTSPRRAAFPLACITILLAISSSGNGFVAALVGALLLAQASRWRHLLLWTGTVIAIAVPYAWRFKDISDRGDGIQHGRFDFVEWPFVLLGSATHRLYPAILLGCLLIVSTLGMVRYRWRTDSPSSFFAVIFVVLTEAGIFASRYAFGLGSALGVRYSVYSLLLICLLYVGALAILSHQSCPVDMRLRLLVIMLCISVPFHIHEEQTTIKHLRERQVEEPQPALASTPE